MGPDWKKSIEIWRRILREQQAENLAINKIFNVEGSAALKQKSIINKNGKKKTKTKTDSKEMVKEKTCWSKASRRPD